MHTAQPMYPFSPLQSEVLSALTLFLSRSSLDINIQHLPPLTFSPVTLGRVTQGYSKSTLNQTVPASNHTNALVWALKPNFIMRLSVISVSY